MDGIGKYALFALAVLIVVAIAFRVDFIKNLVFGTTTTAAK